MATYIQLQESDVQKIAELHGLALIDFAPMEGGASSKSNHLLHSRQGRHVLSVFKPKRLDLVARLGQLLLLLAKHKFPTSRLLLSVQGEATTTYREMPVMIKVYITGQVCRELDQTMLRQIGAAMAGMHQLSVPDHLLDKQPYGKAALSSVAGHGADPEYGTWIVQRLAYLEQRLPQELPQSFIHGDLFYDNVLFVGKKLKAFIDFEDALYYYKGFDLGMGIVGLCNRESVVALEKVRALVAGYEQIRPLEDKEKEALQLFSEYAATLVSCWRYWKYNIDTPMAIKAREYRSMVRIAERIGDIPQARFLEAVSG
ncbi:phosphotransferase [Chloroflexota bacterium]